MGNPRLLKILILLIISTSTSADVHKLQQPRPVRTLGSLFGGGSAKPTPPQQPPPPQQSQIQNEQKSLNSIPVVGGGGVRPLVYQVKYYDRVQNNLLDLSPESRNYAVEKAGVVEQGLGGVRGQYVYGQQPVIPQRYYYNPLIPQQEPTLYTIANIGNTQVLIPCSTPQSDPVIYDSTISLNVDPHQSPSLRVPVQYQPPAQSQAPQPQRTPYHPPAVHQPLVREQVVQAAQDLSLLTSGSAIVGANVNTVPNQYTQGYYYYYLIPGTQQTPQYVDPQLQVPIQYPQYNPLHQYYRQQQNINGVPLVLLNNYGYPQQLGPVVLPQQSSPQPVRTQPQGQQTQQSTQPQGQVQTQQQQQKG